MGTSHLPLHSMHTASTLPYIAPPLPHHYMWLNHLLLRHDMCALLLPAAMSSNRT